MAKVEYIKNVAQRTSCMLVLDVSGSMLSVEKNGMSRIEMLNQGLLAFHDELRADDIALSRVQVAVVNVGGPTKVPELLLDWTDAEVFQPFRLVASGGTPLAQGVLVALDAIEEQKGCLRSYGISYTRPWMLILTDGEPTDDAPTWNAMCKRAREAEAAGKVTIFPVGVGEVNLAKLTELSAVHAPKRMDNIRFREFFVWLSGSLQATSRSVPGEDVRLPSTDPWSAVKL